jgi:ketosteroid isomerase-like protein
MSQEERDEEIITRLRQAYGAYSRGDFDAVIEFAHPDIELVTTGGFTNLRGADRFRAWMEPETLADVVMEPVQFEVAGNSVLVYQRSRGRGVESGIDVEMDFWVVCTVDDEGLVTRVVAFPHNEEARARTAAGLSE